MTAKILSATVTGFDAELIEVECDIHTGMPAFTIVGLGDTSVQESKERIKAAIKNSGCQYPQTKKVVNLAPADIRKHGPLFDLPIALSILMRSGQIPREWFSETVVVGELALDGSVRKITGALAMSECARKNGCTKIIVPKENLREASLIKGIICIGVEHLYELLSIIKGEIDAMTQRDLTPQSHSSASHAVPLLDDLDGHEAAKRALIIAAAGNHHLLLYGAPGGGKSTLAQALVGLMPRLTEQQSLETTKIYSIAGLLGQNQSLIELPPFRSVHQSTPVTALLGGGALATPGELSLAHNGILFADELLEFPQNVLNMLRQPLETGTTVVSRLSGTVQYPARGLFVAATNPCPCGFWGDEERRCTCLPARRHSYLKKLSGPLLDRIDLLVHVPRVPVNEFSDNQAREGRRSQKKSAQQTILALKKICIARAMQSKRGVLNGHMTRAQLQEYCELTSDARARLATQFSTGLHSGRSANRILKLARTIADLDERDVISEADVIEAQGLTKSDGLRIP